MLNSFLPSLSSFPINYMNKQLKVLCFIIKEKWYNYFSSIKQGNSPYFLIKVVPEEEETEFLDV